jgi:hypothetical protein
MFRSMTAIIGLPIKNLKVNQKYNADRFTLGDPMNLQWLLQHKLYKVVKFRKDQL